MKIPNRIQPLVDDGLVDDVISRLMSGKEADVYVVRCGDEIRCAKVYKEASKRSFKQAVVYQEGRKVRNSRSARAMEKGSKYGRKQHEEVWQNTEVDALFKLAAAGVRVPTPYVCLDGVLLMELITDADGNVIGTGKTGSDNSLKKSVVKRGNSILDIQSRDHGCLTSLVATATAARFTKKKGYMYSSHAR